MTRLLAATVVVFATCKVGTAMSGDVMKRLSDATTATGQVYIAMRNELVRSCTNVVPELAKVSMDTNAPWRVRLMAGIVAERVQRGAEIDELVGKDWRTDPEYKREWTMENGGPGLSLANLVSQRLREEQLWWHSIETIWKETGEHSFVPRMREDFWRAAYRGGCREAPVFDVLVEVLAERVASGLGTGGEWEFLMQSTNNLALPHVLHTLLKTPENNEVSLGFTLQKVIDRMAKPEDVPVIEKQFKDKGREMPLIVRDSLQKLKDKAKEKKQEQ